MLQLYRDVINSALKSGEEWCDFQKEYLKTHSRINISQLNFDEVNFSSYEFRNCNFLGVDFSGVNFDSGRFYNCFLSGCKIEFSSFVGTLFEDLTLENVTISDCLFRQSSLKLLLLDKCTILKCTLKSSSADHIVFQETNFKDIKVTDFDMIQSNMRNCKLDGWQGTNLKLRSFQMFNIELRQGELLEVFTRNIEVSRCKFENAVLKKIFINDSEIKDTIIQNPSYSCCSFSNSKLVNQDLIYMGVNVNSFFQSTFLDCKWPSQTYKVGIWGKYVPSVNLLKQPVEDIIGISPKLRKEIQKAQLVDETQKNAKTWYSKLWLWFWGITTEYGRSLLRLTNMCLVLMLFIIVLFIVFVSKDSFTISQIPQYLCDTIPIVFFNFIGIAWDDSIILLTKEQSILIIIDRILGIIFMGLWIGIATNKIGTID